MVLTAEQVLPQGVDEGLHPVTVEVVADPTTTALTCCGVGDDESGGFELHQAPAGGVGVGTQGLGNLPCGRGPVQGEMAHHPPGEHRPEALNGRCHLPVHRLGGSEVARHPPIVPDTDPVVTSDASTTLIVVL
jgi:hypothetical protein